MRGGRQPYQKRGRARRFWRGLCRAPGRPPGGCANIVGVVAQGFALCCSNSGTTKTGGRMSGVYEGLTVIELADRRNQWAGKLLSDGGARVIQIEPIDGSPGRWTGPFVQDKPDAANCLDYWFNNTDQHSVAHDLARNPAQAALRKLLQPD